MNLPSPPPGFVPLPERINRLVELAYDLWWSWTFQARLVFRRLDYPLWRQTAHNPVLMLRQMTPEMIEQAARDETFLELYDAAVRALDGARSARDTWWQQRFGDLQRAVDRVLLRRVRAAPVAADLCRRSRRPRG